MKSQTKKSSWQKMRKQCAFCGAYKYRKYLTETPIKGRLRYVCTNQDKCAGRCANYK